MTTLAGAPTAYDATTVYYRDALVALQASGVPFLVGGSHALVHYTGVARHTKDFDLFARRADLERVLEVLRTIGSRTEKPFPHWLAKAFRESDLIDIIYCSGNGVAEVDDLWFAHAPRTTVLGVPGVPLCPAEEMIWSKAFILERERYDGADVAHLLLALAPRLDWSRLLSRFGRHWRVLLAHLVLFGYIYPSERTHVPRAVLQRLLRRLHDEVLAPGAPRRVVNGTLLSRAQYLTDLEHGFEDARNDDDVHMSREDIDLWTEAIDKEVKPHGGTED
jgi:hypothetical protein